MGTRSSKVKNPTNPVDMLKKKEQDKELHRIERIKENERIREEIRKKEKEFYDKKNRQFLSNASGGALRLPSTHPDIIKFADMEAKKRMTNQLALNSGTFILNQLMMSIQFLGNYEREKTESIERNRLLENDKTTKITKHSKNVMLPDILHDAVDQHIKFRARHGYLKKKVQALHKQTMYIVHENIEIFNSGETTDYSTLPGQSPIYKMELEKIDNKELQDKNHVGYVKLKSFEMIGCKQDSISFNKVYEVVEEDEEEDGDNQNKKSSVNSSLDTNNEIKRIDNNEEEEDDDDMPTSRFKALRPSIVIMSKQKRLSPNNSNFNKYSNYVPTSISNSTSTDSSEYEYITALNTHQPLSIIRSSSNSEEPLSTVTLPDICITNKRVEKDEDEYEDNEDNADNKKDENDSNFELDNKQYTDTQYLNSKYFLNYFINMFKETLANDLGVSELDLMHSTFKGACIYTDHFEIIPVIACPWPAEAFEWQMRQRNVFENPKTKQLFQWLTKDMVKKVTLFGCHVVPLGYAPKTGTNPNRELEWKLIFPEAEKYLENCLTSAQTKVYVATKVLLKTFVEPYVDKKLNMFTTEHLRAHLFWQCEKNFAAWPEEYLGEALLRFLCSLLNHIKIQKLPDYFLPRRNLFENIPGKVLVELHKRIFRITENPVMYLMISFRNLKFLQNFYPRFRYRRLYSTMIIDNPLKIINPFFRNKTECNIDTDDDEDNNGYGHISVYNKREKNDITKRKRTRLVRFKEAEKTKKELEKINERRVSTETIDITFQPLKYMDQIRRKIIFEMFTEHFINMAKQSFKLQTFNQSRVYLNQASRLNSLILEDNGKEEWINFSERINELEMKIVTSINNLDNTNGPDLPKRESNKIRTLTPMNKMRGINNHSNGNNKKLNRSISEESDFYTHIDFNNGEAMASTSTKQMTSYIPEEFSNSDDDEDKRNNDIISMQSKSILKDKQQTHIKSNGHLPNGFRKSTNLIKSPLTTATSAQTNTVSASTTAKDKSIKKQNKKKEISVDAQVHATPKNTLGSFKIDKILSKKRESMSKNLLQSNNINSIEDISPNRIRKQSVSFGTTTTQEINYSESIITTTAKSKATSSKGKYLNKHENKGIIMTKKEKSNKQIIILNGNHKNELNEKSDEDDSTQL